MDDQNEHLTAVFSMRSKRDWARGGAGSSKRDGAALILADSRSHVYVVSLRSLFPTRPIAGVLAYLMERSSNDDGGGAGNVITTEVCEHLKARFSGGKLEVKLKMQQGERASSGYE